MKLSLIIPTICKRTLKRTLSSIKNQEEGPDEIIMISDGYHEGLEDVWKSYELPGQFVELKDGPHKNWGHTPRNHALKLVTGDYVHYIDDDDTFKPDAFKMIRKGLEEGEGPHIFRMTRPTESTIWEVKETSFGNISTQMIVHPNNKEKTPAWGNEYWADCIFIREICKKYPKTFWHEDIIAAWNS